MCAVMFTYKQLRNSEKWEGEMLVERFNRHRMNMKVGAPKLKLKNKINQCQGQTYQNLICLFGFDKNNCCYNLNSTSTE